MSSSDTKQLREDLGPTITIDGRPWRCIARVDELEPRGLTLVDVDGRDRVIARVGDHYRIFRNRCPHQGGPLCRGELSGTLVPSGVGEFKYGMDGEIVRCPWHNWQWNLETGNAVGRTTRRRLTTQRVTEIDGLLYVPAKD